tara:strand:+ start:450 stop:698 length:249 start_codon:yes stop_codon:yes gene_type:complete
MALVTLTATAQDITGDFDLVISGTITTPPNPVIVLKAAGTGGTAFVTLLSTSQKGTQFVKNTGTNAYKLAALVTGMTVKANN